MSTPFARTTRALDADSARLAWLAWLVAFAVLAAWSVWFFGARVDVIETSLKARLEAQAAPHAVAVPLAGRLASSSLGIGRLVHAGDLLAEIDSSTAQLRLQEEQARLQALPPRLASLRLEMADVRAVLAADQRAAQAAQQAGQARVREAGAEVAFAVDQAHRLQAETGTGSVAEIDALRAAAEAGKLGASREALTADLHRTALDAATRLQQAQVQLEELRRSALTVEGEIVASRAAVARLAQEIERHRVRAPADGVIAEVMTLTPGAWVAEGQKLATLVPAGGLLLVAEFDPARALGRLQAGQPALFRLDGYPWAQYGSVEARVQRVAGDVRDGMLRVELAAALTPRTAPLLRHGLTGAVEVTVERATPAALLLRAAGETVGR